MGRKKKSGGGQKLCYKNIRKYTCCLCSCETKQIALGIDHEHIALSTQCPVFRKLPIANTALAECYMLHEH